MESKNKLIARFSTMVILIIAASLLPTALPAADPPTGDEIMAKVRENEYADSANATIEMTLVDKNGKKQVRKFRIERMQSNVLIRFLAPPDVKDSGYLIMQDKEKKTRVYYYFPPPTDDYREITMDDKDSSGASFLGSDFDITDFQIRDPDQAINKYLKTTNIKIKTKSGDVETMQCYVVESIPKDQNYKYKKIVSWISTDYFLPVKVDFYNDKDEVVKELHVMSYKLVGAKRIVSKSVMRNKENNHMTLMEVEQIEFDVKYPDDHFTIRNLTSP
jgi:hypothetical protein